MITKDAEKKKQENWERTGKKHSVKDVKIEPIKIKLKASRFEKLKANMKQDRQRFNFWRDYDQGVGIARDVRKGKYLIGLSI